MHLSDMTYVSPISDSVSLAAYVKAWEAEPGNLRLNSEIMQYYKQNKMHEELHAFANRAYSYSLRTGNDELAACSALYLYFLNFMNADSARFYINQAQAHMPKGSPSEGVWHDANAEYLIAHMNNYPEAIENYKKAEEWYGKHGYVNNRIPILVKMSHFYFLRLDTAGLAFARRAYGLASETDDPYMKAIAYACMASAYDMTGDYHSSLKYCDTALCIIKDNPALSGTSPSIRSIKAEILHGLGKIEEAESEYVEAMKNMESVQIPYPMRSEIYLAYAGFLSDVGRYDSANEVYREGYGKNLESGFGRDDHHYYLGISSTYASLGRNDSAVHYYALYHRLFDSLFADYSKYEFNRLFSDYENERLENDLHESRLREVQMNRMIYLIVSTAVIIILALVAAWYKKRNRMYAAIVERYQEASKISERIGMDYREDAVADSKKDEKDKSLFRRIECLMREDHVYRDKDLSLDKLSEMLDSNRTYVSSVINNYAHAGFYNYVHSYRIKEATDMIESGDMPIKAICEKVGYNSLTSFYRVFQRIVGCTPTVYKNQIRKMGRSAMPADIEKECL